MLGLRHVFANANSTLLLAEKVNKKKQNYKNLTFQQLTICPETKSHN